MRFGEFESIMSVERMSRYRVACNGNTRACMTLYRLNFRLSQELFTVISCFEIALRNAVDRHYLKTLGTDWLKTGATPGGIFDLPHCRLTAESIRDATRKLGKVYIHNKLVAELGFGFWRYLFASHRFNAAGKSLLAVFPAKPISTASQQYNQTFVFNQLAQINKLRNRIAHHEPICFHLGKPAKSTVYVRQQYQLILQLFPMDADR